MMWNIGELDRQIIAASIAAFFGALFGAIATYIIGKIASKRQKIEDDENFQKQKNNAEILLIRKGIRDHSRSLVIAQAKLSAMLVASVKNEIHFADISKGIKGTDNKFIATMSLPIEYPYDDTLSSSLWNNTIVNNWISLGIEIDLQNIMIAQFNQNYVILRDTTHQIFMKGGRPDPATLESDNIALKKVGSDLVKATRSFKRRALTVLAMTDVYLNVWEELDFQNITLEDLNNYKKKLLSFVPEKSMLKAKEQELKAMYMDSASVFESERK